MPVYSNNNNINQSSSNILSYMNNDCNLNEANPSLCIPRIDTHLTKKELYKLIYKKMNNLNFGKIKNIDIAFINKNNTYRIFIHFNYWYIDDKIIECKKYLLQDNSNCIKLMYDFPNFWKCFISNNPKHK